MGCNIPKMSQRIANNKLERAGVNPFYAQLGAHNLHYYEGGKGETVLLIHGFGGDAQVTWEESLSHLVSDHHVLAPDLLWFGKSESSGSPNLTTQVDAMAKLIQLKRKNKITVVGISYGGFVAMGLAHEYPELVHKMVIVNSPGITYNVKLLDELCEKMNVKTVDEIFIPKSPREVKRLLNLAFYKQQKIPECILKDAYNLYFSAHHTELTKVILSLTQEANSDFLAATPENFPQSTIIWGEQDAVFPLTEGKKLASFLSANFLTIPNAGHAVNVEKPEIFNAILDQALAE